MKILNLNSEIPFGKYKGATVQGVLDINDYKYLFWLFTQTELRADDEAKDAISKAVLPRISMEQPKSNRYYYDTPYDADNWLIGNGDLGYDW